MHFLKFCSYCCQKQGKLGHLSFFKSIMAEFEPNFDIVFVNIRVDTLFYLYFLVVVYYCQQILVGLVTFNSQCVHASSAGCYWSLTYYYLCSFHQKYSGSRIIDFFEGQRLLFLEACRQTLDLILVVLRIFIIVQKVHIRVTKKF